MGFFLLFYDIIATHLKEIMSTNVYIECYRNNSLVDYFVNNCFSYHFDNTVLINQLVNYLKTEQKYFVLDNWNDFFIPFKKNIKTFYFLFSYLENAKNFSNSMTLNNAQWHRIENKIHRILTKISLDNNMITKVKLLLTNERNIKRQKILMSWLTSFFDDELNALDKSKYNRLKCSLYKEIDNFIDNTNKSFLKKTHAVFTSDLKIIEDVDKDYLEDGRINAERAKLDGWLFHIDDYSAKALLSAASCRTFRKKVYDAYQKMNSSDHVYNNNEPVLKKIIDTKQKIAKIYKKDSYAQLVLSDYVLNTPEQVYSYLQSIDDTLTLSTNVIDKKIHALALVDNVKKIQAWDVLFYINKLRINNLTSKDNGIFKDYFLFESFLVKFFNYLKKELNVDIKEIHRETINNEPESLLISYKIEDKKTNHKGYLLLSPFNNKIKENPYQSQFAANENIGDVYLSSVQYIQLQFHEASMKQKLSLDNIIVFLHEIGHALYAFYGDKEDTFLNQSLISWDLIELPSQFLEHLVYDMNFMKKMSEHCVSKKQIDKKLLLAEIQKKQFLKAYETQIDVRKFTAQLSIHHNNKNIKNDINEIMGEKKGLYNVFTDVTMLGSYHRYDYAPTGYIYLYSDNIAYQLMKNKQLKIKNVFTNLFNSANIEKMESRICKNTDVTSVDIFNYFKKELPITIYGE